MAALTAERKPGRVLEIACGTGIVTHALRRALPPGTPLIATDLSEDMLAVAGEKFTSSDNIELKQADGVALPFPDGSFDAVVCWVASLTKPLLPPSPTI